MTNKELPSSNKQEIHPVQHVVSSLAIALLERNLAEGKSISIPSLGITIEPDRKATEQEDSTEKL